MPGYAGPITDRLEALRRAANNDNTPGQSQGASNSDGVAATPQAPRTRAESQEPSNSPARPVTPVNQAHAIGSADPESPVSVDEYRDKIAPIKTEKRRQDYELRPAQIYNTPLPQLPPWKAKAEGFWFSYESNCELKKGMRLDSAQLNAYIRDCPARERLDTSSNGSQHLRLRIQKPPAQMNYRSSNELRMCRWVHCLKNTIATNQYRVAFDEFPADTDNGFKDPLQYAFVMHLFCYEQCRDPLIDIGTVAQAETRELPKETKNPMHITPNVSTSQAASHFRAWVKKNRPNTLTARPYVDSLTSHLAEHDLATAPASKGKTREQRKKDKANKNSTRGTMVDEHKGDLWYGHTPPVMNASHRFFSLNNQRDTQPQSSSANQGAPGQPTIPSAQSSAPTAGQRDTQPQSSSANQGAFGQRTSSPAQSPAPTDGQGDVLPQSPSTDQGAPDEVVDDVYFSWAPPVEPTPEGEKLNFRRVRCEEVAEGSESYHYVADEEGQYFMGRTNHCTILCTRLEPDPEDMSDIPFPDLNMFGGPAWTESVRLEHIDDYSHRYVIDHDAAYTMEQSSSSRITLTPHFENNADKERSIFYAAEGSPTHSRILWYAPPIGEPPAGFKHWFTPVRLVDLGKGEYHWVADKKGDHYMGLTHPNVILCTRRVPEDQVLTTADPINLILFLDPTKPESVRMELIDDDSLRYVVDHNSAIKMKQTNSNCVTLTYMTQDNATVLRSKYYAADFQGYTYDWPDEDYDEDLDDLGNPRPQPFDVEEYDEDYDEDYDEEYDEDYDEDYDDLGNPRPQPSHGENSPAQNEMQSTHANHGGSATTTQPHQSMAPNLSPRTGNYLQSPRQSPAPAASAIQSPHQGSEQPSAVTYPTAPSGSPWPTSNSYQNTYHTAYSNGESGEPSYPNHPSPEQYQAAGPSTPSQYLPAASPAQLGPLGYLWQGQFVPLDSLPAQLHQQGPSDNQNQSHGVAPEHTVGHGMQPPSLPTGPLPSVEDVLDHPDFENWVADINAEFPNSDDPNNWTSGPFPDSSGDHFP